MDWKNRRKGAFRAIFVRTGGASLEDRLLTLVADGKGRDTPTMATALTRDPLSRRGKWLNRQTGHDARTRTRRFVPEERRWRLRPSPKESAPVHESCRSLSPDERERLLLAHLPQVRSIALRMRGHLPPQVPGDDVFQAGVVGLIEAADHYNPRKDTGFSTYAQFRVRGAMLDNLRASDWSPRGLRRRGRQLERETARLRAKLGRSPDEFETARAMGMGIDEYRRVALDLQSLRFEGLDEECSVDSPKFADPRSGGPDPFELCLRAEIGTIVAAASGEMSELERRVLDLYYGEELTMKEVGQALGVGESRVCQLHAAAITRLQARIAQRPAADRKNAKIYARGKATRIRSPLQ